MAMSFVRLLWQHFAVIQAGNWLATYAVSDFVLGFSPLLLDRLNALISRFGLAAVLLGVGRISFLAMTALAIRFTPGEEFGLFMVVLAISQILGNVCTLGSATATQLFVGEAIGINKPHRVIGYIKFVTMASALGTVLVMSALLLASLLAGHVFESDQVGSILFYSAIFSPVMALSIFREMLARGFAHIPLAMLPRDIVWPATMCCLILVSATDQIGLVGTAILSLLLLEIVSLLLLLFRKVIPFWRSQQMRSLHNSRSGYKRWSRKSIAMLGNSFVGVAFERVDILLVGFLLPLQVAGIYGVIARVAPLVSICHRFVSAILLPKLSALVARKDRDSIIVELQSGVQVSFLYASAVSIFIALFSDQILMLLGVTDTRYAVILHLLCLAHFVIAIGANMGFLIIASERPFWYTYIGLASIAVAIPLLIILIPIYGLIGAASTMVAVFLVENLVIAMVAKKLLSRLRT